MYLFVIDGVSSPCIQFTEGSRYGCDSVTRVFKECMVQLQKVNRDCQARLIRRSRKETVVDQDGSKRSAIAALDIYCFVI
jgi:hypothetical protein